jgi:hypothetical protein
VALGVIQSSKRFVFVCSRHRGRGLGLLIAALKRVEKLVANST